MKTISIAALLLLAPAAAIAGEDCIENAAGQLVCGSDAAAVRARLAAEDRLNTPELNVPPAPATHAARTATDPIVSDPEIARSDAVQPTLAAADGRDEEPVSRNPSRGSVYGAYSETAFVRGGYIFESSGAGDYDAPMFSTGYRKVFAAHGRSTFALEGELVFSRDSQVFNVLGAPVDVTQWGLSGIGAVRWQYGLGGPLSPFASVGVGPGYFHASIDDGVTEVSDGDMTFVYTGRAGVEFNVSEQFSLETAYRYLGTSQSGTPGYHSAELGLNYNF